MASLQNMKNFVKTIILNKEKALVWVLFLILLKDGINKQEYLKRCNCD